MESKIPKLGQPLSRWKKIVIHDENNKITSIYNLDDKEKLIGYKKKPKRKIEYRKALEERFLKFIESDDFINGPYKKKKPIRSLSNRQISPQLEKSLKNDNQPEKKVQTDESNLKESGNGHKLSLLENFYENSDMLFNEYCSKENDEDFDENSDFSSFLF